jgi:uncharacterized iron-regulated protein
MRFSILLLLPAFFAACATAPRIVATKSDTIVDVASVARDLATADVVALGELHQTPPVHETHLQIIEALFERRPNMVVAMEMFERDVQSALLQYLAGVIDEAVFLERARPWPHYERDYRPVVEFAKKHGLVVLAANAPKELARKASQKGVAEVLGDRNVARETTAPEDDYWDAFVEAMSGHGGTGSTDAMKRFYVAQCLKDDTMAESITDHVQERRKAGDHPLVVLICGRMHSDHGRGTVARIKNRMPNLDVRVLSAETVADVQSGIYESPRSVGDYVIVAPEQERETPAVAAVKPAVRPERAGKEMPADHTHRAVAKPTDPAPAAPASTEGLRPALGLMPDYGAAAGDGVVVASVREGSPAAKAGLEAGDLIVALAGVAVTDVEQYTEVLDAQKIGSTVPVRVRREGAEAELQVVVGSRSR